MSKNDKQKLKLVYLIDILNEYTDLNHVISMREILDKLQERGVKAERKSIYDDFAALRVYGMEIESQKGRNPGYALIERRFDISELRLLVDSVAQSRFITKKSSRVLIDKLAELASTYERNRLRSYALVESLVKSENEELLNTVDWITSAISERFRIEFRYFDTDVNKMRAYHNEGKPYLLNPYLLKWDNQNYYLIGRDEAAGINKTFRVDKMCDVSMYDSNYTALSSAELERLETEAAGLMFGMYAGTRVNVTLRCDNSLSGVIIDRFGRDVELVKQGSTFTVRVEVLASPQFYSWVFGIGDGIRIVSPQSVVDGFLQQMRTVEQKYDIEN